MVVEAKGNHADYCHSNQAEAIFQPIGSNTISHEPNFEKGLFAARLILALPVKNGPMRMEMGTAPPLALLDFM